MDVAGQLSSVIGALFAVLLLIVGLGVVAARLFNHRRGAGGAGVRVLSYTPVGSREKLVLVEVGARRLLLGVTPGAITSLERFEADEAVDVPDKAASPVPLRGLLSRLGLEQRA